jgi:hypothetical protein
MKLQDLIKTNNWLSIEMTLLSLYPDQQKNVEAYRGIFSKLQQMKSVNSKIQIAIRRHYEDRDNEEDYVEVYGMKENKGNEKPEVLAIEFTPWRKWLGMRINESTLKEFNELEIICHCLFEMTFMGYDEKEIQKEFSSLKKTVDELKNMTAEERKKNTTSLDDLLKDLDTDQAESQ